MEFLIVLAILAVVVVFVGGPLRRAAVHGQASGPDGDARSAELAEQTELADLEAAREAKYREIRDAELDHRTGKLSDADFEAVDRTLRSEAIKILRRLERTQDAGGPAAAGENGSAQAGDDPQAPGENGSARAGDDPQAG
jgi:acetyl-CoA acetyltransferase